MATSTLFLGVIAMGVHVVLTVEEARWRAIGAAMILAPLLEAREMGYRVNVLRSSYLGYPVYARLGFREYCKIRVYE